MAKEFIRNVVFTLTPLGAKFRYKEEFQVFPLLSDKAPQSEVASHFPVCIEYWIDTDEIVNVGKDINKYVGVEIEKEDQESTAFDQSMSKMTFLTNKLREICNLLSAITNHRFFTPKSPKQFWALPLYKDNPEDYNECSSFWAFEFFYYPELPHELKIEYFSDLGKLEPISLIPTKTYYLNDPFDHPKKLITFPDTIHYTLDRYYSLNETERRVVNSTIYLICNSLELRDDMKSLALLSAVSAIETLINYEYRNEKIEFECKDCQTIKSSSYHCQKCNRPIWGIAQKFRKFLLTYVSSSEESRKKYNKIYSLRSKIAHTDYLISGDNFVDWSGDDKTEKLRQLFIEAIQLSRLSLVHWLLRKES